MLNKQPDGACVFLDAQNRCRIHSKYGESAKPLACRIFPFSVRPVAGGWQASFRFDCPSAIDSKGESLARHRSWLGELTRTLDHHAPLDADTAIMSRGVRATPDEIRALTSRLLGWITDPKRPMMTRLIGAARLTMTLYEARFRNVRGARFEELLDLLFAALDTDARAAPEPVSARQRGLLRQFAFAHAEHVTLDDMRRGLWSKLKMRGRQLNAARAFLRGQGSIPALPGIEGGARFEEVERVSLDDPHSDRTADLLQRYLIARIEGRSVFGAGYYGWPMFAGLAALWLSVAAVGWLARYRAAADRRSEARFEDVAVALGMVDRAATRLPALGTLAERSRVAYLVREDGLARLLFELAPTDRKLA